MKLIAQGALAVGLLLISTPSFAQSCPNGSQSANCNPQSAQGAPAPLVAAGVPSALVLFGGIFAARRARRRRSRPE